MRPDEKGALTAIKSEPVVNGAGCSGPNHGDDGDDEPPHVMDPTKPWTATRLPFLLKGNLREYQHMGLDWLVCSCFCQFVDLLIKHVFKLAENT